MKLDEDDGEERKVVAVPLERDHKEGTPSSVIRRAERLLASRIGDKCFVLTAGWWSYEVCLRDSIRQYHLEGHATPSIYHSLGKFNPSASASHRNSGGEARATELPVLEPEDLLPHLEGQTLPYLQQMYTGGDDCDMDEGTRLVARTTELRLACSSNDEVFLKVREPSECRYILVMLHPALCELPDFQSQDKAGKTANVDKRPQHDEL
eukprot:jgi/Botrbrau1/10682/Bobra.139_2s0012.1